MDLPAELRLLVYDKLIPQNVDLYPVQCRWCKWYRKYDNPASSKSTEHANLVWTQILRTNQQIYSETLPLLYSENSIHFKCLKCERAKRTRVWTCSIDEHDIITELTEHYHLHVNRIAIEYTLDESESFYLPSKFVREWPRVERPILERYKNTQYISLRFHLYCYIDVTLVLGRRGSRRTPERVDDFTSVLADYSGCFPRSNPMWSLRQLEFLCKLMTLAYAQGHLIDAAFAVKSILWNSTPWLGDVNDAALHLGYNELGPSDTVIGNIEGVDQRIWPPLELLRVLAGVKRREQDTS